MDSTRCSNFTIMRKPAVELLGAGAAVAGAAVSVTFCTTMVGSTSGTFVASRSGLDMDVYS